MFCVLMFRLIFAGESTCTLKNEVLKQIIHQVSFVSHKRLNNCQSLRGWKPVWFLASGTFWHLQAQQMGQSAETSELVPKELAPKLERNLTQWVHAYVWCYPSMSWLFHEAAMPG